MNPSGFFGLNGLDRTKKSNLSGYLLARRAEDPVKFLNELVFRPENFLAVGVKIKYDELLAPASHEVLRWLLAQQRVRVIHLTRNNRLRRFISLLQISRTRVVTAFVGDAVPPPVPFSLSFEDCVAGIEAVIQQENQFRTMFSQHSVFEIAYEDFADSAAPKLHEVQKFLEVNPEDLHTPTIRIGTSDLRAVIINYDQLQQQAQGSPYAAMFD